MIHQCVFLRINEKSTQYSKMYKLHLCCLLPNQVSHRHVRNHASKYFYLFMASLVLAPHMAIQTYLALETMVLRLYPHRWGNI